MAFIPNTRRRGAIYWFRRSRRLPNGNLLRPTVSLRTACPKVARKRAAVLAAKFEELFVRLFSSDERRFALDARAAARIFQNEFNFALDALEQERELSTISGYEYGDIETFIAVHEEIYRYLAETNAEGNMSPEEWFKRVGHHGSDVFEHSFSQIEKIAAIFYEHQDQTAAVLDAEGIETDIFFMDHARRLRFEARLAAAKEYRSQLKDPSLRYERYLNAPPSPSHPTVKVDVPPPQSEALALSRPSEIAPADWATKTAQEVAAIFIEKNPKLSGSANGKREAKWTIKTKSQFETALRLLQKSMGDGPFVDITDADLRQLLKHFDHLPPHHHKSPRHQAMTLAEICEEAQLDIQSGKLRESELGLNVPTLNRHFRFIRMAHDWVRGKVPSMPVLDWGAVTFDDTRNAREQRSAFPVSVAASIFDLPIWQGSAGTRQRFKPGHRIIQDSFYWVLPIIWYSGMRREEACKLRVSDIATSPKGIFYFDIADTEAGRLKNQNSRRLVPFADELLRLGLPNFVSAKRAAGEKLLFPELVSETRNMGESYYRKVWTKLLAAFDEHSEGLSIHGIRHMVADELKAAGVSMEIRSDLLGHALGNETADRYSKASRLNILREAVNKIPIVSGNVEPC